MATKPTLRLDWLTGNANPSSVYVDPGTSKKTSGWALNERPSYQVFNFVHYVITQWMNYFESKTDVLTDPYTIVVGNTADCTHATLAAAAADNNYGPGQKVYIKQSQTISTAIQLTKNDWRIEFAPGVSFTASVSGSGTCLQVAGVRNEIQNGRFVNFATGIQFQAGSDYGRVRNCWFNNCTTEVDDTGATAGRKPTQSENITE